LSDRRLAWLGLAALAASCGGASSTTSPDSGSPVPTPTGLTITISTQGVVAPKTLTIKAGSQVTFVNNDSIAHLMFSDPHPEHTDCPEINQVGFLPPGEARQTGNLNTIRTCGYHDHDLPLDTDVQGSIIIQ
jgi:plastocyanin